MTNPVTLTMGPEQTYQLSMAPMLRGPRGVDAVAAADMAAIASAKSTAGAAANTATAAAAAAVAAAADAVAAAASALPSASFTSEAVTGKLITGFVTGAGAVVATDTILSAINKLDGNNTLTLNTAKSYADGLVVGLWDDRGNYDASGNAWPSSGGSGAAGAILKGDVWTISVVATAGALNGCAVGTTVRAVVDTPGQTSANWAVTEVGLGYIPENAASKDTSGGYPGLTLFKLNLRNTANTITSWFTNAATVARTWTMPDKDGTVAMTSDITGTNSGTNTGDQDLSGKQDTLVSGTNIKTVGGTSLLGSGDIALVAALPVVIVTLTTQTATAGNHYVLTNVAATTLTLPLTPASGDTVAVTPDNALTTNIIGCNAKTIMGVAGDMTIDNASATVTLRFLNSTWRIV